MRKRHHRHHHRHERRRPGRVREQRLREIVDGLVPGSLQKRAYLDFARELAQSLRGNPPALQTGSWKLGPATTRHRRFPDYSMRTKRVVAKWFRRGLSGRLLWLIGEALIREIPGR